MPSYDSTYRLFRRAVDDTTLCPWCFARRKILRPEYDEAEAKYLSERGGYHQVLMAHGHRVRADGSVQVDFSTSDPHPSTVQDVPPSTTIDGEYKPAVPRRICQCGVIDYGSDNRSLAHLHTCLDNLVAWIEELDLSMYPDEFDRERAHDIVTLLRQYDTLVGRDEIVLTTALWRGFVATDTD